MHCQSTSAVRAPAGLRGTPAACWLIRVLRSGPGFRRDRGRGPWRVLRDAGHQVVFATEQAGTVPAADPRLLTGVLFGQLGAAAEARSYSPSSLRAPSSPRRRPGPGWTGRVRRAAAARRARARDAAVPRLAALREQVARFWATGRPVGAICHGVLVLARTRDAAGRSSCPAAAPPACPSTWNESPTSPPPGGRPVLPDLPRLREDEVRAALDPGGQFERGLVSSPPADRDRRRAVFVVQDRNYLSRLPATRTVRPRLRSALAAHCAPRG